MVTDFYNSHNGTLIVISVFVPIVVSILHLLIIGAKGVPLDSDQNVIQRFSMAERVFHFIRMLSFVIVAGTGIYFVIHGGSKSSGITHSINGGIFFIMSICTLAIWYKAGLFKKHDGLWLRRLGGYLIKEEVSLPADKFNAGQKVFYWVGILLSFVITGTGVNLMRSIITQTAVNDLILVIHGVTAVVLIVAVIGHIYLSLWVNKGTWRILINGKVSEEWAECHHSLWKPTLQTNKEAKNC